MKRVRKRKMVPGPSLGENYALAIKQEGIRIADLAEETGVLRQTIYRYLKKKPITRVTPACLRLGTALGFSAKEIRDKIHEQWALKKFVPQTKRDKILRLIAELVQLI